MSVNIVSLITCKGLSYIGVTRNGELDPDPSDFNPLHYGFGAQFKKVVRRYGPSAFTIKILGHGYADRENLCLAQRKFIKEYKTVSPHGYNILKGRTAPEHDPDFWAAAKQRSRNPHWRKNVDANNKAMANDSYWRRGNDAGAARRAKSPHWRVALDKRSQNAEWRRKESVARRPVLHNRWHVKRGLVPEGITVENCYLCKEVVQRKGRCKNWRERWKLSPNLSETPPGFTLEEQLDDITQRVNAMFKWA
jgi:hypothetical protein